MDSADIVCQFLHCLVVTSITLYISMASRETMDTNCMTLTRFILAEQKKYAPGGTGETRLCYCCYVMHCMDVSAVNIKCVTMSE